MTEFELAIHRRLNLLRGEWLDDDYLQEETKNMASELMDLARKQIASEIDKDSMQNEYIDLLESRGMERDKAVTFSVAYCSGIENTLKAIQEEGKYE